MPKSSRLLKKNVEKVIDLKLLFPHTQPNFRTGLTKYQAKKIRAALREINANSDGKIKNQVQIKNKAQRVHYMQDNNLPIWQKVIILPGGSKINKNVQYKNGELKYTRNGEQKSRFRLNTEGTSDDLKKSAQEILKKYRKGRKAGITAAGAVIGAVIPSTDNVLITREALYIFNKYSTMFENGEYRSRRTPSGARYHQPAAHPSQWGMGILFEKSSPKRNKK